MAESEAGSAKRGTGLVPFAVMALLLTALAGGGAFFGYAYLLATESPQREASATEKVSKSVTGHVVPMPPIVTNLSEGASQWVRLEMSILFDGERPAEVGMVEKVSEDVLALMRTLNISQISGATGWLHLKEELTERISLRTDGRAKAVMIHSMIIE